MQAHAVLGYLIIFIAMIIEGDIFLFTAAFLTHLGYFDPIKMFVAVYTGSVCGDLFWYWLGLKLNGSSRFTTWTSKMAVPFDSHLLERPLHTIFLSKFIYGIHHAILVRAGMLKLNLAKFLRIDLISILGWVLIVGSLGFAGSVSFDLMRHSIKFVEYGLLGAFLTFVIISYLVSFQAKKKL